MRKYLLDTNICVYFLRGRYGIAQRIAEIGWENCCISEITIAELLYGAENSNSVSNNKQLIEMLCDSIAVLPIRNAFHVYAQEKVRLRQKGTPLEDLDLLIGATAKANNCVIVTENVRHMERINELAIENWIKRD